MTRRNSDTMSAVLAPCAACGRLLGSHSVWIAGQVFHLVCAPTSITAPIRSPHPEPSVSRPDPSPAANGPAGEGDISEVAA